MQDNFRRWSEKAEKFLKPATDEDAEAKTRRLRTKTADGERVLRFIGGRFGGLGFKA